jgi:acyl-CoA dehydrogenase
VTLADTHSGPREIRTLNGTSPSTVPYRDEASANDVRQRARLVAAVASQNASIVDRGSSFPAAAIAAAKEQHLMGIYAPAKLGGEGATITEVVEVCYALGRACASTGMIYAMHQIMVACLVRHGGGSEYHRDLLRRLCEQQLLLASSTTDGQGGGDLRKSDSSVVQDGARFSLVKSATVMSYGAQADGVLTTARRAPDALPTDQVLVALSKEDYRLTHLVDWDTLGMRGTCSSGFTLEATGAMNQVCPEAYSRIHTQTVMPFAHLTWSAVWAGIAAAAVDRARAFTRGAARKAGGQLPPGATHLTRATATLATLRGRVAAALHRYEGIASDPAAVEAVEFQTSLNLLKVNASELSISAVMSALQACGLSGYRNDGDFSVARCLRDVLSSPIMINNDRILANTAGAAMLVDVAATLTE